MGTKREQLKRWLLQQLNQPKRPFGLWRCIEALMLAVTLTVWCMVTFTLAAWLKLPTGAALFAVITALLGTILSLELALIGLVRLRRFLSSRTEDDPLGGK